MRRRTVYYVFGIILCWCTIFSTQEESSQWCAGLLIDVDKYTCCSGTIHNNPHLTCCGKSAYNVLEASCCSNELTLGVSQTVSKCCGSKAYNPLNQICCGGHVLLRNSAQTKCCGSELYEDRTHLCCGPEFEKVLQQKKTGHDLCCGKEFYNPRNECCCDETLQVVRMDPVNSKCCRKRDPLTGSGSLHSKQQMGLDPQSHSEEYQELTKVRKAPVFDQSEDQYCGSHLYNPNNSTCCLEQLFLSNSGLTQCCGAKPYQLSEEGVLCCNGQLYHNQPAGSMCAGNVPYSPDTYTVCQKRVHLPASKQCCGKESFDPHMEICCNGHRHKRSRADMTCCGFNAYSPSAGKHKCCSGYLHDMRDKGEAGCCGSLLLTDMRNQQCCHSTQKTLVYKSLPGHSCCGHWYYNMSIWSCCAGQLIPTPTNSSAGTQAWAEDFILRPLTDHDFSAICTRTVMLGTVRSSAVKGNQRFVVLANALKIQGKRGIVKAQDNSFLVGPLEHCNTPPLEQDRTYLWKKICGHQYKPISDVPDLTTAIYSIMTFCQSMAKQ